MLSNYGMAASVLTPENNKGMLRGVYDEVSQDEDGLGDNRLLRGGGAGVEDSHANEKEQLDGFMMVYELVRPIC